MTCALCGTEMEWAEVPASVPEYVAGNITERDTVDYIAYCPNQDCIMPETEQEPDNVPF